MAGNQLYISEILYAPERGRVVVQSGNPAAEDAELGDGEQFSLRMFRDIRRVGDVIQLHAHATIEVICVIDGEAEVVISEQPFHIGSGSVVLLNSGMKHALASRGITYYVMQITPAFLERYAIRMREHMPGEPARCVLHQAEANQMREMIHSAFRAAAKDGPEAIAEMMSDIFRLFAGIISYTSQLQSNVLQCG